MRTLPDGMREKVLIAAELFADFGLDATKMEDVAAATGVPKATLYYYFEGKEDILAFLFVQILDELGRAVADALRRDGNAAERLGSVVRAHLGVIEAFPAASRALQFDLGRAARSPVIAERTDAAFIEPVGALLVEGARDGSLRPVEHPRLLATAILGAVTTTGLNALTSETKRPFDRVADDLANFVLRGVAA
jgi:TetR/AcrR family transcriptional regulator